jgi:hypothetical protein
LSFSALCAAPGILAGVKFFVIYAIFLAVDAALDDENLQT